MSGIEACPECESARIYTREWTSPGRRVSDDERYRCNNCGAEFGQPAQRPDYRHVPNTVVVSGSRYESDGVYHLPREGDDNIPACLHGDQENTDTWRRVPRTTIPSYRLCKHCKDGPGGGSDSYHTSIAKQLEAMDPADVG